jgi:signal transduction histidine kinase
MSRLIGSAQAAAAAVAAWPETGRAIRGDASALARLFEHLDAAREQSPDQLALAVLGADSKTLAWSGPIEDRRLLQGVVGRVPDAFVVAGSVSTTLIAAVPLKESGGRTAGIATAEIPLAVRRNIKNGFLADYDRLADLAPGLQVRYVDVLEQGQGPRPFASLAPDVVSRQALLRAADGDALAAVRAVDRGADEAVRPWLLFYRRLLSALSCGALLAWMLGQRPSFDVRLACGATGLRLVLLLLGAPWLALDSPLVSPDVYASTLLDPFLRCPLDLIATAALTFTLAALVLRMALNRAPQIPTWRGLLAPLLAIPLVAATFAWIADSVANASLSLESLSPVPQTAAHFVLQAALLLVLATGAALLTALFAWGGPSPELWRAAGIPRLMLWTALLVASFRLWPRETLGLPLLPALALVLVAALAGSRAGRLGPRLREMGTAARIGALVLALDLVAALLAPTLAHFGEKNLRAQIERDQAPLVLRQPQWRQYVLDATERRVDSLELLEEAPPGPRPPLLEELAFSVWSTTELASAGLPSAIEIQDPSGALVSRFALSLPAPPAAPPLPTRDEWVLTRERLPLASAARFVLHVRRRFTYHGEVHGAVHLYVADDLQALPVAGGQDPYTVLFRSTQAAARERPVELVAWGPERALLWSSADRPPGLDERLLARVRATPSGLWTSFVLDAVLHHAFVFSDGQTVFALGYPRRTPGRYVADILEAVSALTLLALLSLAAILLARTLARRRSFSIPSLAQAVASRFSLRLFVAFVAIAILPVIVLETVVRSFVEGRLRRESESQALEMAAVAKKAVEDFAFFQQGEAPGHAPVTDAALVWVASLIRNDLDVFERGRLLASSKRELYASGLLPTRISGTVYSALALTGQPSALRPERIGGFSYQVVSVPLQFASGPPAILSIPLALREREVQSVLDDLDRSIRLASILFLTAAGLLAHSMARRISGPVHDLTQATRRVAEGDLGARVQATSRDEFQGLLLSFNQMASDLERQRHDLARSNRLAAWAEMARQVAHEVKNPLTPIQLAAQHLRRVWADSRADFGQTLDSCTETILQQVQTLRGIVTEFSAFARPPAPTTEAIDVGTLLAAVAGPYRNVLAPEIRLSLEIGEAPRVHADRRLLERAVLNLLENALQAVGERGAIALRLSSKGPRVEIEVEDSGPGLDPQMAQRVFEPFFSTKTGGSGLGLPLVRKIAEDHGGGAGLSSEPGRTRAVIWLPAAPSERAAKA